ncbi:MAG: DUF47 family protein [Thermoleophilia bacterium]|nr:DUF47 family protein [Thermoleophilia bacterium]
MADLKPKTWFLPETPDVLGLLRKQLEVTIEGADMFVGWADGEPYDVADFREVEERGDHAKRELMIALREAFVTPLDPEDLFTLSRNIDWILNGIGDLVGEAEVLDGEPDEVIAEMAKLLARAVRELDTAVAQLDSSGDKATAAADRSIEAVRELQASYYQGMATTLTLKGRGRRISRREIYRRCRRISETTVDVAERIVYSVVKEG